MVLGFDNPYSNPRSSFIVPVTPPDVDPDAGTPFTTCFAEEWLPFVLGALAQLTLQTTWSGDDSTILQAQERAQLLIALFANPESCGGKLPWETRVQDGVVQSSTDGGETWQDNPLADPRNQTLLPPPDTGDPQCDAAARVAAVLEQLITETIDLLQTVATQLEIADALATILVLFMPEIYVILTIITSIVAALALIGWETIDTAFTPTVYADLFCVIFCGTSPSGDYTDYTRGEIEQNITDNFSLTVAAVANYMLELMGTGGMNNIASAGTQTGDCGDCDSCGWCIEYDFSIDDGGFAILGANGGNWVGGSGWEGEYSNANSAEVIYIGKTIDSAVFQYVEMTYTKIGGSGTNNVTRIRVYSDGTYRFGNDTNELGAFVTHAASGNATANKFYVNINCGSTEGEIVVHSIRARGTGDNPDPDYACTS